MGTLSEPLKATISIAVIRDTSGDLQGYQVLAYLVGGGALSLGPVCSTRDEAGKYMDVRVVEPRVEGGFSIPGVTIKRVY